MKFIKTVLPLFFLFSSAVCAADYRPAAKKKYSLFDREDEIYRQFDDYGAVYDADETGNFSAYGADVSDADGLPVTVQEIAGLQALGYLEGGSSVGKYGYSPERWKKKDELPADYGKPSPPEKVPAPPEVLPPGITAELPFESSLSLSGRKLIGIEYSARKYDREEDGKRKNTSSLKMEQELQMRVFGSVGKRLNINVDYDDTADKKDISLVYTGEPDEFVQKAAFGDISVSLPSTEFSGYSKELFGLKVDTRYKTFTLDSFFRSS